MGERSSFLEKIRAAAEWHPTFGQKPSTTLQISQAAKSEGEPGLSPWQLERELAEERSTEAQDLATRNWGPGEVPDGVVDGYMHDVDPLRR